MNTADRCDRCGGPDPTGNGYHATPRQCIRWLADQVAKLQKRVEEIREEAAPWMAPSDDRS